MASERKDATKGLEGEEEHDACLYAMQIVTSAIVPMALRTSLELGILDVLVNGGRGQLSAKEIAAELRISNADAPVMLDRILRLLASYNVVTLSLATDPSSGSVARLYGPSPVCKYLAKDKDGVNMVGPLLTLIQDRVVIESLYFMEDLVKHGRTPFDAAHGAEFFEYMSKDSRFREVFFQGMSSHSTTSMKLILDNYDGFGGVDTLVDVGGGKGASSLRMIVSKYPHIRGINFDLPHVADEAPPLPGVEHIGGDMFESVPNGDVIFLKWILHDWSDESCVKLLRNCWKALPTSGKVVIAECILPEEPDGTLASKYGFQFDLQMMAHCKGGKERTQQEFLSIAKQAGFASLSIACQIPAICVMEVAK